MPTPWFRRVKQAGELTVFNSGGAWSSDVEKALATFNGLGFPVKLVKSTDEKNALIKVKLAMGPDSVSSWGNTVSTKSDFDPNSLHGVTVPLTEIHERKKTFESSLVSRIRMAVPSGKSRSLEQAKRSDRGS